MKAYRDYIDSKGVTISDIKQIIKPLAEWSRYVIGRNDITEIRIIDLKKGNFSGYFDNFKDIITRVLPIKDPTDLRLFPFRDPNSINVFKGDYPRSCEAMTCYFLLNRVNPALLCRCKNHIEKASTTTSDIDILSYSFILIDVDSGIPAQVSATNAEKGKCLRVLKRVRAYLRARGIDPIIGSSGNGYHALVPVDMPNNEESVAKIKSILAHLHTLFGEGPVKIDQKVFNASRISKLFGTGACKGSHAIAEGRVHRIAYVMHMPQKLRDNPKFSYNLDALLNEIPVIESSKSTTFSNNDQSKSIDIASKFLTEKAFELKEYDKDGRHFFTFKDCPLHKDISPDEHTFECSLIIESNGAYAYNCFHEDFHYQDFKTKTGFSPINFDIDIT